MNKYIITGTIILSLFGLTGCNSKDSSIDASVNAYNILHQNVIAPPESLYDCPEAVKISKQKINNITELQVAKILFKSVENNRKCNASIKAIKEYIAQAQSTLDQ